MDVIELKKIWGDSGGKSRGPDEDCTLSEQGPEEPLAAVEGGLVVGVSAIQKRASRKLSPDGRQSGRKLCERYISKDSLQVLMDPQK